MWQLGQTARHQPRAAGCTAPWAARRAVTLVELRHLPLLLVPAATRSPVPWSGGCPQGRGEPISARQPLEVIDPLAGNAGALVPIVSGAAQRGDLAPRAGSTPRSTGTMLGARFDPGLRGKGLPRPGSTSLLSLLAPQQRGWGMRASVRDVHTPKMPASKVVVEFAGSLMLHPFPLPPSRVYFLSCFYLGAPDAKSPNKSPF